MFNLLQWLVPLGQQVTQFGKLTKIVDGKWNMAVEGLRQQFRPEARTGHVAITLGECMVIWGGYQVCSSENI